MFFLKLLIVALLVGVIFFGSSAFSQSTPPLDKPIERTPADQLSESGRVQQMIDEKRDKTNSPDSDNNYHNIQQQKNGADEQNQFEKDTGISDKNIPGREK